MVKDIIVIYRKYETIGPKHYFSHPKNQYLTQVFLNFKESL